MARKVRRAPLTQGLRGKAKKVAQNPARLAQMNRTAARVIRNNARGAPRITGGISGQGGVRVTGGGGD